MLYEVITTNLSAAGGAVAAMLTAWVRYKRPTLSLSLNGALAGLVAITAGCAAVSPLSALVIGLIAGVVLVFAVEFIDQKLKVDDPVGAISRITSYNVCYTKLLRRFIIRSRAERRCSRRINHPVYYVSPSSSG